MTDITRAEVCVTAIADLFRGDGEITASPMGLIPSLGGRLARLTFEPDLLLSDGEAYLVADAANPSAGIEGWQPFKKVLDVVVPHGKRHVIMGASQIDRYGNQNISAIGDHAAPSRQLLGVRGGPGNTVNNRTSYWIPKHSTRVFVDSVDVISGVGHDSARAAGPAATRFHDVYRVITDLAVLGFDADGVMTLLSVHPGVTEQQVREATGFDLGGSDVPQTRLPDEVELELIRTVVDPRTLRAKEVPA
ncbi:Coenzyme A transferase OS=Tsukamurella paurometabola (strain ATCC 8368 / DSM / CCUG 35730 /CIP 100753 / JCM 10117 / KCTC 9821 / NBRC 16120 / NCIMB 702349/ NCTC 13040) OX=521096 GN=Tpau_3828 PE=3 SV=1 [Tsukamurella paurometabola]|uniref:Coenzyme A transferase n=1 Tax=Tsukamurella paurometabola (strain ATCC 8368 / DSM 20162 / CCUG 35730 / CIP 100753 / JCM 10117 / KCTC 9821 / NBRC 16120 / NCIMB 702349 / NCTC 13040) TaxID=521096 RepID=D5UYV0_TSUPD|nr:CoA-transferase [Tsukamurella paurometabola]ADG80403.1 coenzyme A transferase [Tsukamurella paurometabola DSM 20162]SUP39503.1 3-oxoadipate CoA-transferase subunit B [Tsukamurella paurometabola]